MYKDGARTVTPILTGQDTYLSLAPHVTHRLLLSAHPLRAIAMIFSCVPVPVPGFQAGRFTSIYHHRDLYHVLLCTVDVNCTSPQ